jgi:hypothetical protein
MDLVHETVDLFHEIFSRIDNFRIIPKLFQIYILVLVILHLDPCLTFYNYN